MSNRTCLPITSAMIALFFASCADFAPPPVISPFLIANARADHIDSKQLSVGYTLFVSRCLDCHTLPPVAKYSRDQWPHLVSRMASRANLTKSDESAVIAYLRAASAPSR